MFQEAAFVSPVWMSMRVCKESIGEY